MFGNQPFFPRTSSTRDLEKSEFFISTTVIYYFIENRNYIYILNLLICDMLHQMLLEHLAPFANDVQ